MECRPHPENPETTYSASSTIERKAGPKPSAPQFNGRLLNGCFRLRA